MSKIFNDVIYVQRGSFMDMIVKDCIGNKDWTHPPRKYVLESEGLKEIEKLKQQNKKLKKCVEFYANRINWNKVNQCSFTRITDSDEEVLNERLNHISFRLGGKLARLTLKEIEESK